MVTMIPGPMVDDAAAAERLNAQIQAVLDFHGVFSNNTTEESQVGADALSMHGNDGDVSATAAGPPLDAQKLQKLASIRDIMSKERCFDADSRAASFRCFLGNHRELSLEGFLEAVDEFEDDLFEPDFHVPTIDVPPSSSKRNAESSLLPVDSEEDIQANDLFDFPASPAGRAKRNSNDCDFNPFDDIDRRLKALKEARLTVKLSADDSPNGDWSNGKAPPTLKQQKTAIKLTSSKATVASHSSSSEGSQDVANPAREFKVVRRRSSTSTRASNISRESMGGSVTNQPTRAAPRKMQRGAGASEVIRKHLERRNKGEGIPDTANCRQTPTERISKIQEAISTHLESKILRTLQSRDSTQETGRVAPTTLRRTARRFANRKSLAHSDGPTSSEVSTALEVLTKHLESRIRALGDTANSSPLRPPASPSRRRRTVTTNVSPQSISHSLPEASLSSGLDLSQSKIDSSQFDPATSSGPPASPRRNARRQTVRTRSAECTGNPPLSPARTVRSQSSTDSFGQRSSSPSRRSQRSSKLQRAGVPNGAPSPAGRASSGGSAQSHAAQVIKEHLERLQTRHQNKEAFQVMSDWANENTSDRNDDPFCLDNVKVVPMRDQLAIPDISDTDATTSERSEDPFQMSYASGLTNGTRGASSSTTTGLTPRRKATSRRISASKASSRHRRGSPGGADGGEALLPAPVLELPSLPELSPLGNESDDSKHRPQRESWREESVVPAEATAAPSMTKSRPRRERSVSPVKRKSTETEVQPKKSSEAEARSAVVPTTETAATTATRARQPRKRSASPIKRQQMESEALAALLLAATTTTSKINR